MFWRKRRNKLLMRRLAAHMNARRYDDVTPMLSACFSYIDAVGSRIDGPGEFIDAVRLLHLHVPDETVHFNNFSHDGDVLLITGEIASQQPEYCWSSLWRVTFSGDKIAEVEVFRENNAVSIPALYHRFQNQAEQVGLAVGSA